ncbi:HNH endonuclease, partial [Candidatus Woesearchaeota archaeon]|nr:HNH endonuclease [Candidatus Woesearchaeota archaeon]
ELYSPDKDLKKRNYNIEHILPQKEKEDYGKEEDKEVFDKIGNLLIIPRHSNSGFGAKSPIEKFDIMKSDAKHFGNLRYLNIFLNEYKDEFKTWNFETINKRSEEIANNAYNSIWNF